MTAGYPNSRYEWVAILILKQERSAAYLGYCIAMGELAMELLWYFVDVIVEKKRPFAGGMCKVVPPFPAAVLVERGAQVLILKGAEIFP